MSLIDADKFVEYMAEKCDPNAVLDPIILAVIRGAVKEQPTAYDVDKVVEQLEDLKSRVPVNRVLDDIINDKPKELGMLIAYDKAIEIVKAGGIDGN